eukprot:497937-Alexandrium_andersonii.AAC.1
MAGRSQDSAVTTQILPLGTQYESTDGEYTLLANAGGPNTVHHACVRQHLKFLKHAMRAAPIQPEQGELFADSTTAAQR